MKQQPTFLTTTEFHILLALRDASLHGYQIIKQVGADSDGSVVLLTGTLYNAIKRLSGEKLIQAVKMTSEEQGDTRRKYYALTEKGRSALGVELRRYELSLRLANSDRFTSIQTNV